MSASRSQRQRWAEAFVEALLARARLRGLEVRDDIGLRTGEAGLRLERAVGRFEHLVFGGRDRSGGRFDAADVDALPRPPSVPGPRFHCVALAVRRATDVPEAWDYAAGVALLDDEDEVAAVGFGRARRTLSVSYSEGEARLGHGGDMPFAPDVPGREALPFVAHPTFHPFWALARCLLSEEALATCHLGAQRTHARFLDAESHIVSVFRRSLGLFIENAFGEDTWRHPTVCAIADTPEALERWRREREPAVRALPGEPCPRCGGTLVDAELHAPPPSFPTGKDYATIGGALTLRCAGCGTVWRTAGRRELDVETGRRSYFRDMYELREEA
jgi:hypothetical protein